MIVKQYLQTFWDEMIFNLVFYTQPHYQSSIGYNKDQKKKKEGVNQKIYGSQKQGNQLRRAVKGHPRNTGIQQTHEHND